MEQLPAGTYQARIEWIDTDASGIYHNSTIARFVEAAEARLMERAGIVRDYFPVAPRVTYRANFHAPLFFGQQATTIVRLTKLGTSSMTFSFETWGESSEGEQRVLAASGEYVTACISGNPAIGEKPRSAPWPPQWITALYALSEHADQPGE